MTKEQIYLALNPNWWILSLPNLWQTSYLSTIINFENQSGHTMSYVSEAPFQTYGLNAGITNLDQTDLTETLRQSAAQRLYDQHCTNVVGNSQLAYQFGAQS